STHAGADVQKIEIEGAVDREVVLQRKVLSPLRIQDRLLHYHHLVIGRGFHLVDKRLDKLLEVHEPVGKLKLRDLDDVAVFTERRLVFAVQVEEDHVRVLELLHFLKDGGRGAGLPGSRRAEERDVLCEKLVGVEEEPLVLQERYRAEGEIHLPVGREDHPEVGRIGGIDGPVQHRGGGDAPLELPVVQDADELDVHDLAVHPVHLEFVVRDAHVDVAHGAHGPDDRHFAVRHDDVRTELAD